LGFTAHLQHSMCDVIINTLTVGFTYTWVLWASGYRPDSRIRIRE